MYNFVFLKCYLICSNLIFIMADMLIVDIHYSTSDGLSESA